MFKLVIWFSYYCTYLLSASGQDLVTKHKKVKISDTPPISEEIPVTSLVECIVLCKAKESCSMVHFAEETGSCFSINRNTITRGINPTWAVYIDKVECSQSQDCGPGNGKFIKNELIRNYSNNNTCLLYTSPSPRD